MFVNVTGDCHDANTCLVLFCKPHFKLQIRQGWQTVTAVLPGCMCSVLTDCLHTLICCNGMCSYGLCFRATNASLYGKHLLEHALSV